MQLFGAQTPLLLPSRLTAPRPPDRKFSFLCARRALTLALLTLANQLTKLQPGRSFLRPHVEPP